MTGSAKSSLWFSRLTLRREEPGVAPLLSDLVPDDRGAAMSVGHRLMWSVMPQEFQAQAPVGTSPFLWRESEAGRVWYMLGARPVETQMFRVESKLWEPVFRPGDRLAFDLRVNATIDRKIGEAGEDRRKSQRFDLVFDRLRREEQQGAPTPRALRRDETAASALHDWLADRGKGAGFQLTALNVTAYRVEQFRRRREKALRFGVSDLRGLLEITDPEAFHARVSQGFGRAKAFGCGLMLLRRARGA